MEINLALITHHPTLSIAVLGIQQAWVVLPICIAIQSLFAMDVWAVLISYEYTICP